MKDNIKIILDKNIFIDSEDYFFREMARKEENAAIKGKEEATSELLQLICNMMAKAWWAGCDLIDQNLDALITFLEEQGFTEFQINNALNTIRTKNI